MESQLTLTFLAGLAGSALPLKLPVSIRSDSAKLTQRPAESFIDDGPASPTSGTFAESRESGPTLLQGDFLASHSVKPGSEEARTMTASSGRRCCALSRSPEPLASLERTLLESPEWNSTACYHRWIPSATPGGRLIFQLQPSARHTSAEEFGLLPTLLKSDGLRQAWCVRKGSTSAEAIETLSRFFSLHRPGGGGSSSNARNITWRNVLEFCSGPTTRN